MGKLKTHQSIAKRIRVTKTGKFIKRKGGQDHFNAHESGKTTRNKRRDIKVDKSEKKFIRTTMPYA
jgi:large subunit ribosomal protein L35